MTGKETLTRRQALLGGTAVAALAAVPVPALAANYDDDPALKAVQRFWDARTLVEREHDRMFAEEAAGLPIDEAPWEAAHDAEFEALWDLIDTPANKPMGVIAKAIVLAWYIGHYHKGEHLEPAEALGLSLAHDARRIDPNANNLGGAVGWSRLGGAS